MSGDSSSSSSRIRRGGGGNGTDGGLLPHVDPLAPIPTTAGGFFSGLVMALTMFAGFESAAVLGGEAESPRVLPEYRCRTAFDYYYDWGMYE